MDWKICPSIRTPDLTNTEPNVRTFHVNWFFSERNVQKLNANCMFCWSKNIKVDQNVCGSIRTASLSGTVGKGGHSVPSLQNLNHSPYKYARVEMSVWVRMWEGGWGLWIIWLDELYFHRGKNLVFESLKVWKAKIWHWSELVSQAAGPMECFAQCQHQRAVQCIDKYHIFTAVQNTIGWNASHINRERWANRCQCTTACNWCASSSTQRFVSISYQHIHSPVHYHTLVVLLGVLLKPESVQQAEWV